MRYFMVNPRIEAICPMRALVFLLLLCAAGAVPAQMEAYQASVNVPDQSAGARDSALREALGQVIGRVSGESAVGQASAVLARASQLVQRYGYERDEQKQLVMTAAFDPKAVDAALKAQGLPVFGVVAGPVEDVGVSVSGLHSSGDYARVLNALRAMPGVKAVQVRSAEGDRVRLSVRAEGGASRLAGAVSIGGTLVRSQESGPELAFTLAQ
jgi:hypothetical protein